MQTNTIHQGECAQVMASLLPDASIDLVVTSPPYDDLREYQGYTFDFAAIAAQLWRVIKPGGVVVWVVGDATVNGSETGTSFRQALGFMGLGFRLHDTMIYQTNKPLMNDRRYQACFEYMFVLSKGAPIMVNLIKEGTQHPGVRNSGGMRSIAGKIKGRTYKNKTGTKKVKTSIWYYPRSSKSGDSLRLAHPATFPEALARDHILSWSNPGDLVLDPMCGSGTVPKMAVETGRRYIGIDISADYCELSRRRVAGARMPLPGMDVPVEVEADAPRQEEMF